MFQQPDRTSVLHALMQSVHKAIARAYPAIRGNHRRPAVPLTVPGLMTDMQIKGVDVRGLMVPDIKVKEEDRLEAYSRVLPYFGEGHLSRESSAAVSSVIGRQTLDFVMLSPTPTGRMARLLWAFGKGSKVEVSPSTLVVSDASGEYGVREGRMVGGIYDGSCLSLPVSELLKPDSETLVSGARITEVRRILVSRSSMELYKVFCLLYAIAEWDSTVLIDTLLTPKPKGMGRKLDMLATEVLETENPCQKVYKALVPCFMPYSDFVSVFGRPDKVTYANTETRMRLINKLYSLPFYN